MCAWLECRNTQDGVGVFGGCRWSFSKKTTTITLCSTTLLFGGIPLLSATVAQIGDSLPKESCHFQIVNAHPESITVEHICGGKADIILAEPYFEMLEGWHIQEALNYFYLIKSLKRRQVIKSDAISVPAFASIKACAIELHPDVFGAYSEFPSKEVCGFRHDDVTNHGALHHTYDKNTNSKMYLRIGNT